jgi:hypothetical protein
LLTAGVLTAGIATPTQALQPAGVGPRDPKLMRFPAFYTDDSGVALQICVTGGALCAFAKPRDLQPPEGEAFYWVATGQLTGPGIELSVEFALEAAWASPRKQIVFDRLRVRGHVDLPGTYTLTHPYGTVRVTAEDPLEQRNVDFTQDVGCACDFARAASAPNAHITDFLVNTTRPRGFLGRGEVLGPATIGIGGPSASMSVIGPAGSASTSRFAVLGQLAPRHRVQLPHRLTFANKRGSRQHTVTLVNLGTEPVGITGRTLVGSKAFHLARTAKACKPGTTLRSGGRCRIGIRFAASQARGIATARVIIKDDTPAGRRTITLRGR